MALATTSTKPYLIRAIYEWIVDNDLTPFIAVDTKNPDVYVPKDFIKDDQIILNIAPRATNKLRIGNDAIEFQARFSGVVWDIFVPIDSTLAIYAKENNEGMMFNQIENTVSNKKAKKPKLSLVEGELSNKNPES